jgi:putative tricarboxylic transport membrane protein
VIDIDALSAAFGMLFSSGTPWLIVVPGILIGLVFGAIPGLQISMAMAIFLPLTLYMDFMQAMLFLTAIFTGGGFGGSIPAVLMNIPGTSSSIATAFDGYPMSRQGKHNLALGVALGASCVGVIIGYSILLLLINPISQIVLKVGPAEMAAVILWGITLIGGLSSGSPLKGLISGLVGLLIGTIGYSEAGVTRGTFGSPHLLDGVPVIPAMIGMFAASELFRLVNNDYLVEDSEARKVSVRQILAGFRSALTHPWIVLRGSLIGVFVGSVPGVGSSVANLLSYMATRRQSPEPDSFGKGNPSGVIASEAANSTSEAGSMATLLALGIPGGGATAVMLAAFAMHNITGGPQFIREQTDVVYARAAVYSTAGQRHQGADELPRAVRAGDGDIRRVRLDGRPQRSADRSGFFTRWLGLQALRLLGSCGGDRHTAGWYGRGLARLLLPDQRGSMELPPRASHHARDTGPAGRLIVRQ